MKVYLNYKTKEGIETVDDFHKEENQSLKDFKKYVSKMVIEYHLSGMNVYRSIRCSKQWKQK